MQLSGLPASLPCLVFTRPTRVLLSLGALLFLVFAATFATRLWNAVLGGTLDHIGLLAFAGLGVWTLTVSPMLAMRAAAA